ESSTSNFLLYRNQDGAVNVDVLLKDETIWLTINQMAELFGIDKSGISRHIKNIFETGELEPLATVAKIATVQKEGNHKQKSCHSRGTCPRPDWGAEIQILL
ncbi:MAG: hypothetical protein JKY07_12705, partial [SAR324 cluster bacterium]|nr:hypothetical protein [SAR324 cluster bacterium]